MHTSHCFTSTLGASVFSLGRLLWREKMAKGLQSIFAMPWERAKTSGRIRLFGEKRAKVEFLWYGALKGWMCFSGSSILLLLWLLLLLFQICYSNISSFCPSSWEKRNFTTEGTKCMNEPSRFVGYKYDMVYNLRCLKSDVCPQDQTLNQRMMNWEKWIDSKHVNSSSALSLASCISHFTQCIVLFAGQRWIT